jgi:hypothetical protein
MFAAIFEEITAALHWARAARIYVAASHHKPNPCLCH